MTAVDAFASQLLEEAKRFREKATDQDESPEGRIAYLHAALSLCFSALEAHINSIADDFTERQDLTLLDRSMLTECEVQFEEGEYTLSKRLKIFRLEDRIEFLHRRFSGVPLKKTSRLWSRFKSALQLRNRLTHPREATDIKEPVVRDALTAVVEMLDLLYQKIYRRPYPEARRGLDSKLSF